MKPKAKHAAGWPRTKIGNGIAALNREAGTSEGQTSHAGTACGVHWKGDEHSRAFPRIEP